MVKGKKKTSLKAALSSAQARLKKRRQAEDAAAQAFDQRVNRGGAKAKAKGRNSRRSTIPFKASDNILLIGEGNFSFAVALLQNPPTSLEHLPPANITATAYDTEAECYAKYPDAEPCVRTLREKGAQVLFGVDTTRLEKTSGLKGRVFDRIVWNFPHAGHAKERELQTGTGISCLIKSSSLAFFALRRGSWSADLCHNYSRRASANVPETTMTMGTLMRTTIKWYRQMVALEELFL